MSVGMWGMSMQSRTTGESASQKKMAAERHQKPSRRRTERDDDAERKRLENALEIGLEDTFPASDAFAAVQPVPTAGLPGVQSLQVASPVIVDGSTEMSGSSRRE